MIRICLSKWIEKGNKNCPLCRKEIEMYRNLINNNENNNWSFSFRLESTSRLLIRKLHILLAS
jgi:hypothetical protein